VVDAAHRALRDARVADLPALLHPGDLLVVNDAATLPASLHTDDGRELRLAARRPDGTWLAVLFGAGDWRTRTEDRAAPAPVAVGDTIPLGELVATVIELRPESSRLVALRFDRDGAALWSALYRRGRPVQYAYLDDALELWHTQTAYASRPWAVEQPSAGRPLTIPLLLGLARRGVALARVTHAAGLSSTGDPAIDAILPFPEHYDIPVDTAAAISRARRVIAAGTTVVRALEGCAATHGGRVVAGEGTTDLLLSATFRPRVVDGVLTGQHEPGASHFHLLEAFAPRTLLDRAHAHAVASGYLGHEFGDSMLLFSEARAPRARGAATPAAIASPPC
jgi:S-adenosylmethionine:tRNA ribosyltransferase-isomerase